MEVDGYDPWANPAEVKHEYGIEILSGELAPELKGYSAIILAVSHKKFYSLSIAKSSDQVVFDVKGFLKKELVDGRL